MVFAIRSERCSGSNRNGGRDHPGIRRQGYGTADEGAQTVVYLATLPDDGPTGVFYDINHESRIFPW